jgi:N-acyl-D-aspartate/D-glutamate deacylase
MEDPDSLGTYPFTYPGGPPELDATYHHTFWKHPASALGIDTGVDDCKHKPHTPTYMLPMIMFTNAFPGFIERYVLKEKIFTIEQAVHKTSTQAANRYRLTGRGVIAEGSYADIVLLDLKKLKVNATVLEPRKKPSGIEQVIVNGVTVIKGEHTGERPGKVIRRKYDKKSK